MLNMLNQRHNQTSEHFVGHKLVQRDSRYTMDFQERMEDRYPLCSPFKYKCRRTKSLFCEVSNCPFFVMAFGHREDR